MRNSTIPKGLMNIESKLDITSMRPRKGRISIPNDLLLYTLNSMGYAAGVKSPLT